MDAALSVQTVSLTLPPPEMTVLLAGLLVSFPDLPLKVPKVLDGLPLFTSHPAISLH